MVLRASLNRRRSARPTDPPTSQAFFSGTPGLLFPSPRTLCRARGRADGAATHVDRAVFLVTAIKARGSARAVPVPPPRPRPSAEAFLDPTVVSRADL